MKISFAAMSLATSIVYGVWGDINGGISTGEASISLADMCYLNDGLSGDNGHNDDDVLFIGFTGKNAIPSDKTNWDADDAQAFEDSIKDVGDQLIAGLKV